MQRKGKKGEYWKNEIDATVSTLMKKYYLPDKSIMLRWCKQICLSGKKPSKFVNDKYEAKSVANIQNKLARSSITQYVSTVSFQLN